MSIDDPLNYERIDHAVCELYENWNEISEDTKILLNHILDHNDLKALFVELSDNEQFAKETIIEVEKKYPNVVKNDNVDQIIDLAMKKKAGTHD